MAVGIVETRGFNAAVEALDAMCKDAKVSVKKIKRPGGGHITLLVEGDVAAVISAVEAGVMQAEKVGGDVICHNVIPSPHPELMKYLSGGII